MHRPSRPLVRLLTVASLFAATAAPAIVASQLPSGHALAAPNTDCANVTEPPTVNGIVQLTTPGQLKWLATNPVSLSATIEQQNDLDLTACGNWPGIGGAANPFTGAYDGGGLSIVDLTANLPSATGVGLFGYTSNATLSSINVAGTVTGDIVVGGLVGRATGGLITLSSAAVTVSGNTASNKRSTGGLAGETLGTTIVDSSATGHVTGNSGVGGLVGYAENTAITSSHASGDVSGTGEYLGGLVGYAGKNGQNLAGPITDSYATGDVTGADDSVGGLVGYSEALAITRTFATGTVSGPNNVGGLVGESFGLLIEDSTTSATVTGSWYVGGLVGLNYTPIVDSHASVTVSGTGYVGGLVGYNDGDLVDNFGSIESSTAHGSVTATGDGVGGLSGVNYGDVSDSHATASVSGASDVGGLVGEHWNLSGGDHITGSSATGVVSATGDRVGGLIGSVYSKANFTTTISASTASGAVTGRERVGGLIGYAVVTSTHNGPIAISDVSASGDVTSSAGSAGGLIGRASNHYTMSIFDASATGDVTSAGDNAGGLIGWLYDERSGSVTTLERAYATGDVSAPTSYAVGGLIGNVYHFSSGSRTTITQTHAHGDASGFEWVGGLIGDLSTRNTTLSSSFATGDAVAAQQYAGGLVGWVGRLDGLLIGRDLYAQGNASGPLWNAALIGGIYNYNDVDLDNAYASGTATGATEIGGAVAGQFTTPGTFFGSVYVWTVDNVFYATDSAYTRVDYGTAVTRAQLDQFATYANAGWSITDGDSGNTVWGRCDGITYPFLMWQTRLPAGTPGRVVCPTPVVVLPPAIGQLVTQPVATSTTTVAPSTTTTVPGTTPAPTDVTPPPVQINGELPDLPAGDVVVVEDGQPVAVNVIVENDTELVLQASTFELSLEGDCATGGCTIDTTPEGRAVLTLEQDGSATTTGIGFQPGSRVDVWLFSEPRYLGRLTVRADGTFEGDIQLDDVDVGEHTLQVNGISQTGAQRSANLGVVVNPEQAPTPDSGVLPATGSNTTPISVIAVVLLGLGVVTITRRRTA